MVDRDRILVLLDIVHQYTTLLEEVLPLDVEEYLADSRARLATERALQVAIEALVDTAALFVSGLRLGLPPDEENLIARLARTNVLPPDEAALLADMRRFRNVLVHRYGLLDDRLVHAHAAEATRDLLRVAEAFRHALEK